MRILFLIPLLLISFLSHSQSYFKVLKTNLMTYENEKWNVQYTHEPENEFIIIKGNKVTITDPLSVSLITYGDPETKKYEDHTSNLWDGYDENGKKCTVIYKSNDTHQEKSITVIINDDLTGYEFIVLPQ